MGPVCAPRTGHLIFLAYAVFPVFLARRDRISNALRLGKLSPLLCRLLLVGANLTTRSLLVQSVHYARITEMIEAPSSSLIADG